MLVEELRCFCRVVRGLEPVPLGATYEDAVQVQRWLDRLENSVVESYWFKLAQHCYLQRFQVCDQVMYLLGGEVLCAGNQRRSMWACEHFFQRIGPTIVEQVYFVINAD